MPLTPISFVCDLHAGKSPQQNMVSSSSYAAPVAVVLIAVTLLLPASWFVAQWRSGALTISARLLRRVRGIVLVLVVVVLFTASTIVLQLVFEAEHHRMPFLILSLSTCHRLLPSPPLLLTVCFIFRSISNISASICLTCSGV